jgi:Mce-associated membrane protein
MPMSRRNLALYGAALLLVCACVAGGVLSLLERGERAELKSEQERYGAVLASARTEARALVNIDYRDPQAAIDAITSGATGEFKEQLEEGSDPLTEILEQGEATRAGDVVWAGVVAVDDDSARVIVATEGTVTFATTTEEPRAENFRMQLDLQRVDGDWLTSKLEFIR